MAHNDIHVVAAYRNNRIKYVKYYIVDGCMIKHPKEDFAKLVLGGKRLKDRFLKFLTQCVENPNHNILSITGLRSDAKAVYRMFSNPKFDVNEIKTCATNSVFERMSGTVLLVQDTTFINLDGHKKTKGLGINNNALGVRLHSCVAFTTEGLPLGLVSQSCDTRLADESELTKSQKKCRSIKEKESNKWFDPIQSVVEQGTDETTFISVSDRESDMFELYDEFGMLGIYHIVRVAQDRRTDTDEKLFALIHNTKAVTTVTKTIPRDTRNNKPKREATFELAYCHTNIQKPKTIRDKNRPKELPLTLVRITEINPPKGEEPIEWILATNLPINNDSDLITIVGYYEFRWLIERFHYVLKSGLGAEEVQLRTFDKIQTMLYIFSIVALYIMAITYTARVIPELPCTVFFDEDEWKYLYRIVKKTKIPPDKPYSMEKAVEYLGELGGYKRNPSDGAVGLESIWNGLFKLYFAIEIIVGQV